MASGVENSPVTSGSKTICKYLDCMKNHAANVGGHAVDGCGEFMPAGPEGTLEALKCGACNCHRNFHRKEMQLCYRSSTTTVYPQVAQNYKPAAAFGSTSGGGQVKEEQEGVSNPCGSGTKKRFRTKFTQEQKEKMLTFAEKLCWKMHKHDEAKVEEFCNDTGLQRNVLKVWMHNNKYTLGKKK
ncbi:hypothetical protein IFM89_007056 [Coptis chinensis]|uniref:ZF-HD dimerization-type domain-containing protein n=1 Tax=Coptis chinensis TaxID=261450 RepID=A0A835LLT1_9MAGN|nr:hypothetical protein IFM89_007056 [Coptis chinensis]